MTKAELEWALKRETAARKRAAAALKRVAAERDALREDIVGARDQQAATAEILRLISASPTDAQPVFDAIVNHARRLLDAHTAIVVSVVDGEMRLASLTTVSDAADATVRAFYPRRIGGVTAQVVRDCQPFIVSDVETDPRTENIREIARARGYRSLLFVPMVRDGQAIGIIQVGRREAGEFAAEEVELLKTFAEQAVIAIENVRLFTELQARNRDLTDALEQQTATSEILKVIAGSPTDIQPVFDTIAERAMKLCGGQQGLVYRFDGDLIHIAALANFGAEGVDAMRRAFPMAATRGSVAGRAIVTRAVVHVPSLLDDPEYALGELTQATGFRSAIAVPMLRSGTVVGVVIVTRLVSGAFSDRHIALLRTFADQAVIAIENVRLFTELEHRNRALTEALEQQTATAEILRVISSSTTDLQPVFDAIVHNAVRLCGATNGGAYRFDGALVHSIAHDGYTPEQLDEWRKTWPRPVTASGAACEAIRTRSIVRVADLNTYWNLVGLTPEALANLRARGSQSFLAVPMLREDEVIGAISLSHREVAGFTDTHVELLKTFADQAVIAIENVRLFTELEEKHRAVTEALEQQTATSDILRVISQSPTDVQPVFDTIVGSAKRLLRGFSAIVTRLIGDSVILAAFTPTNASADDMLKARFPRPLAGSWLTERVVAAGGGTWTTSDTETEALTAVERDLARARGYRSVVAIPLRHSGTTIGMIAVTRGEPGAFRPDEIALLRTFADQAVIAIENVRLFTELREKNRDLTESLDQQTATSEILRVISSSPTDVQPVFEAIADSAARLTSSHFGGVMLFDGQTVDLVMVRPPGLPFDEEFRKTFPLSGEGLLPLERVIRGEIRHVADMETDPSVPGLSRRRAQLIGYRGQLQVPMFKDGRVVGILAVARREPGPFSDAEISLLQTFAAQAVIAIENVRLFTELQERNRAVTEALEQQTATSEILRAISSSPTDIQPVFDAIAERALRLSNATVSGVAVYDGDLVRIVSRGNLEADSPIVRAFPMPASRTGSLTARAIFERQIIHAPDVLANPDFGVPQQAVASGFRSVLAVPMLRDGKSVGCITVGRAQPGPYSDRQIDLLKTFAEQAVIAIENVRLFTELQEKNRALTQAHAHVTEVLDRQTATNEILRVISTSPTDAQPVFDTIARSAKALCAADYATVHRFDGERIHLNAHYGLTAGAVAVLREVFPYRAADGGTGIARALRERRPVHIENLKEDPGWRFPTMQSVSEYRTLLMVPMLQDDAAVGAISIGRTEVRPFSDEQIQLLETFAAQAVIAIENVRLFTALEQKNRALTEALDQQMATGEILRVIASSPTDVQPVFDAIVQSAARLCRVPGAVLIRPVGDEMHLVAASNASPEWREVAERAYPSRLDSRTSIGNTAVRDRTVMHVPDVTNDVRFPMVRELAIVAGIRSVLFVPMIRNDVALGAIGMGGVEPFSDDQIALLRTFADQAVIAIENVRLFTELQEKNRALTHAYAQVTETLDRQTATADILRVISSSPGDVQPVFDAIAENALRLSRAHMASVLRYDGEWLNVAAATGFEKGREWVQRLSGFPMRPHRGAAAGRSVIDRTAVNILDVHEEPGYRMLDAGATLGFRSVLAVPMLRESEPIGTITVHGAEPNAFGEADVSLLRTFADQALIAIENVRLFTALRQRTSDLGRSVDQLTALGEVSRAVNSTIDLDHVLNTVVSRASVLAGADGCSIFEYDEPAAGFRMRATSQVDAATLTAQRAVVVRAGEGAVGRLTETHAPVQIADIIEPGVYDSPLRDVLIARGYRALLAVPMIHESRVVGGLVVSRTTPGEFPAETIDLLSTFANQSALAIANARLFREIEEKSAQLEVANQHKSEFLANMSHELRTPLNAVIGFSDVLLEGMFGEVNEKQTEYLQDILSSGKHLLSLINDILDLSKIEAGRMELDLSDFDVPQAIGDAMLLMRERATRQGIALGQVIDERLGRITADERKFKQVLLNLLSNAVKFTPGGGKVDVRARVVDSMIEVAVADTGEGIAPEDQAAVFEEFRQVGRSSRKVEGTGLGLALCRKFVELHGGTITVDSAVGVGSTFTFTIPASRERAG